jgi:transcriptional regulator with XRE-family HTH domain
MTVEVSIGQRIQAIRRDRRATLRAIARRANLTESFLSQVERGRANASIPSLQRVAEALGVTMAELFDPNGVPRPRVTRVDERRLVSVGAMRKYLLTPRAMQNLEVLAGEFDPGGSTGDEPHTHGDSEEMLVVVRGAVGLQLGDDIFELRSGDSIDYRSSTPHRVYNNGDELAEVLWIISPPSY